MAYENVSATVLSLIDGVIVFLVIWIIIEVVKMFGSFTGRASSSGVVSKVLDRVLSPKGSSGEEAEGIPAAKEKLKKRQGKVGTEEAAEEAFTLDAVKKVKEAYENLGKIGQELRELGSEALTDQKIEKVKYDVGTLIGGVLSDAQKWENGVVNMAKKLRREFKRDDARVLKEREEKALAVAQEIKKELQDAKEGKNASAEAMADLLDKLKKNKTQDGNYNKLFLNTCASSLNVLANKLKRIYEHLEVLFKLEKEIESESVKEEAQAA